MDTLRFSWKGTGFRRFFKNELALYGNSNYEKEEGRTYPFASECTNVFVSTRRKSVCLPPILKNCVWIRLKVFGSSPDFFVLNTGSDLSVNICLICFSQYSASRREGIVCKVRELCVKYGTGNPGSVRMGGNGAAVCWGFHHSPPPPPQTRDRFKSPAYKRDFYRNNTFNLVVFLNTCCGSYTGFWTELVPVTGTLLLTDTGLESDVTGTGTYCTCAVP